MNSIHDCVSELIKRLTELYRDTFDKEFDTVYIFNDVYELVITLWWGRVIDSELAMDILKFYYDNNKYRYIEPTQYTNYSIVESMAIAKKNELINKLPKIG